MRDDLHSDGRPDAPRRAPDAGTAASDREVPLPGAPAAMADAMHAWLDGEGTEAAARRAAGDRAVELWCRLAADVAGRGRIRLRAGFVERVMAALPASSDRA